MTLRRRLCPPKVVVADGRSDASDLLDALACIEEFGNNIRHADTKAGLLLTATIVMATTVPRENLFIWTADPKDQLRVIAAALTLVSLIGLVYSIYRVLLPQVNTPPINSRYSWPSLARMSRAEVASLSQDHNTSQAMREGEAWAQAWTLARICAAKFWWAAVAARGATCALAGLLALYLLTDYKIIP